MWVEILEYIESRNSFCHLGSRIQWFRENCIIASLINSMFFLLLFTMGRNWLWLCVFTDYFKTAEEKDRTDELMESYMDAIQKKDDLIQKLFATEEQLWETFFLLIPTCTSTYVGLNCNNVLSLTLPFFSSTGSSYSESIFLFKG